MKLLAMGLVSCLAAVHDAVHLASHILWVYVYVH